VGAVTVEESAGGAVVVLDHAAEMDRLTASAGPADLGGPAGVLRVVEPGYESGEDMSVWHHGCCPFRAAGCGVGWPPT